MCELVYDIDVEPRHSDRRNGPITIAIRARFEHDSTTIRLQHATTRYEVFRALAYEIVYEIVYENQW